MESEGFEYFTKKDFWYVLAESWELGPDQVLSRKIMGEWLAVFRDTEGRATALQDRCLHRSAQLSRGTVSKGRLSCPYHGWQYDAKGRVVAVPSQGPTAQTQNKCAKIYAVKECDDFIYVT